MTLKLRFYSQKVDIAQEKSRLFGIRPGGPYYLCVCKMPLVAELVELAEGIGRHGGDGFKFWQ
ncbi:MAG: hypothetical protein J6W23_01290, partial [Victivallales bacterium]|nr:hypothetical protein [Victivallales bacterium]